jgi:hypothetical protein
MTDPFSYSTTFVLDKAHFNECFSNCVVVKHPLVTYYKAIAFLLVGILLVKFSEINAYIAYFVIGLGFIEAISNYYKQPWWVTRQMLSRTANSEVSLTLDETGIHSRTANLDTVILWQDISEVNSTDNGLLLVHTKGKNYISNSCLTQQAKTFLSAKVKPQS